MSKSVIIAMSLLMGSAVAASAHSVDAVRERQADRIEQGRETGKITWREGLKLRAEQKRIARTEAQFRSDGYLSASERRKLSVMQKDASQHIYAEKHDSWKRAWWLPRFGH
jgi:hypothetical protein